MALLGQASGDFRESSSALRLLHVGIRNTVGVLTTDAFTQTNPPVITTAGTISTQADTGVLGVLSGSVAFTRPDQGSNYVGGPVEPGAPLGTLIQPLGCFINSAAGNAYENLPAAASGKGPYVSAQGTYGNALFETQALAAAGAIAQGDDLIYQAGQRLVASRNGYLQMAATAQTGALINLDLQTITAQSANAGADDSSTTLGILKMPPDSEMFELVYDQRI